MPETIKPLTPGAHFADLSQAVQRGLKPELQFIDAIRRGDWVNVLVSFSYTSEGQTIRDHETISGIVSERRGNGIVIVKVLSRPGRTDRHGLDFGDFIAIPESAIIQHLQATPEQLADSETLLTGLRPETKPYNEEDRKLRERTANLAPIAPTQGKRYWLRNGAAVTVWTERSETAHYCDNCNAVRVESVDNSPCPRRGAGHVWTLRQNRVFIGGDENGATLEWTTNGTSPVSRDLDIVKDLSASEVITS